MFITIEDFKAVVDNKTLDVINQSDSENLNRAVGYAIDEISGYLRGMQPAKTGIQPYDIAATFAATGNDRNRQLVMHACDIALYHLISWLPQKMGFEIRQIRYQQAMDWLADVQAGKVILDIPTLQPDPEDPNADNNAIKWGSWGKNQYDY